MTTITHTVLSVKPYFSFYDHIVLHWDFRLLDDDNDGQKFILHSFDIQLWLKQDLCIASLCLWNFYFIFWLLFWFCFGFFIFIIFVIWEKKKKFSSGIYLVCVFDHMIHEKFIQSQQQQNIRFDIKVFFVQLLFVCFKVFPLDLWKFLFFLNSSTFVWSSTRFSSSLSTKTKIPIWFFCNLISFWVNLDQTKKK